MNKMMLFCVASIIMQSGFARYPGIRTVRNKDAKLITIVNTTNDTIYVRLKPVHIRANCTSCVEKSKTGDHVDECCRNIKTVEYAVPSNTTQRILLDKIHVSVPGEGSEYLDFTQITYAKIYDKHHNHHKYITITNKQTYIISCFKKNIIVG